MQRRFNPLATLQGRLLTRIFSASSQSAHPQPLIRPHSYASILSYFTFPSSVSISFTSSSLRDSNQIPDLQTRSPIFEPERFESYLQRGPSTRRSVSRSILTCLSVVWELWPLPRIWPFSFLIVFLMPCSLCLLFPPHGLLSYGLLAYGLHWFHLLFGFIFILFYIFESLLQI